MWLVFYYVSKHLERYEKYGTVYIEVFEKYVKYVRIRINAHMNVDNVFIQKYAHIWLPDPPNVWYLGVQYSDQAPAIISLQIENDKFIEKKPINLLYCSHDIRKFTLSILKRYRKYGQYDKKQYKTENSPIISFISSISV